MIYQHIDVEHVQTPKRAEQPCGDTFLVQRTPYHTTIILADGIGSGIKAHVASQMNSSRLAELLEGGSSLRDAFMSVVGTMSKWRDSSMPFSAFLVARILNDGVTTILNYEMPHPILVSRRETHVLRADPLVVPAGVASEYHMHIHPEEAILLMSDGIPQAGVGRRLSQGWTVEGVEEFVADWVVRNKGVRNLLRDIMRQAQMFDGPTSGDDRTCLLARCRTGQVIDVLTGPPVDKANDADVARTFLEDNSLKVICGATTADIVARYSDKDLEVEQSPYSLSTPPRYFMEGIDIVTEGAITLTQAYNIIDEDLTGTGERSAAADLADMFKAADWVRFTVGLARNPANADIVYRKQGILPRDKIVPLLADKLEKMGKLVTVHFV